MAIISDYGKKDKHTDCGKSWETKIAQKLSIENIKNLAYRQILITYMSSTGKLYFSEKRTIY